MSKGLWLLLAAYFIMLMVIFILPCFSLNSYSILKHTTSQLAGQNMPNAWIMNLTFVLLGTGSIFGSWKFLSGLWLHRTLIVVFGISLILTAYFSHAPIEELAVPFDTKEDEIHSYLAKITGFSFTSFAVSMAFVVKSRLNITLALLVAAIDTIFSAIMFNLTAYTGLLQRAIFVISFGWLVYLIVNRTKLKKGVQ